MALISLLALAVSAATAEPSTHPAWIAQAAPPPQAQLDVQPSENAADGSGKIDHKPLERTPRGSTVFLRARIQDPAKLFAPLVFARAAGSQRYEAYSMADRGKRGFVARLPAAILDEGSFEYFIEVRHDEGNASRLGSPLRPFICVVYDPPPRPVQATFRTEEPGAAVKVDENDVGKTPVTVALGPGVHVIQAIAPDGRSTEQQIDVKPGRKLDLLIPLPARLGGPASLGVTSDPSAARVLIDGKVAGTTPYAAELPPGPHTVAVELEGRLRQERQVTTRQGRDVQLAFVMPAMPKDPALTVDSDPTGALVTIDGKDRGRTPFLAPIAPGKHELILKMPGRREVGTEFAMPRDKDLSLRLELPIAAGAAPRLTVSSVPDGASVAIDGKEVGLSPWSGEAPFGEHKVLLRRPGYVVAERSITVQSNRDADVSFALERAPGPGRLRVETEPPDAVVSIDGRAMGEAPYAGELPSGEHSVEVSSEGYRTVGQQIALEPGQQVSLRIALVAATDKNAPLLVGVNSSPEGAMLFLDGRPVGPTPKKAPTTAGQHELRLILDGYKTWSAPTRLPDKPGFELRVAVALKPVREAESHEAPAALELARSQYKRAEACYASRDYACAQAGYQAAYEYTRRPELLFNIAQARRKLGNYSGALDAYQAYLQEQPRIPPKVRSQAEQYIAFCQLLVQPVAQKPGTALAKQTPGGAAPPLAVPLPTLPEEDLQPPAIGHNPVRKAARDAPLRLAARIVDERSAVGDAQACWRNLFHIDFQCEPLRAAGEDEYAALIPASAIADGFAYYLEAYDSQGNGPARSGSPDLPHAVAVEEAPPTVLSDAVAGALKGPPGGSAAAPAGHIEPPPPLPGPVPQPEPAPSRWSVMVHAGGGLSEERFTDQRSIGRVGVELARWMTPETLLLFQFAAGFGSQGYRTEQPSAGGIAALQNRREQRYDATLGYGYDAGPLLLKSGRLTAMPMLFLGYTRLQNDAFPTNFFGPGGLLRTRYQLGRGFALAGAIGWARNLLTNDTPSAVGGPRTDLSFRAGVELPFAGGNSIALEYRGDLLTLRDDQRVANGASVGFVSSF